MNGGLAVQAEVLKLARLLRRDPGELQYLEAVPAADLRALREQVTELLFTADGRVLSRLAAASKLLPIRVVATIGERAFGPVLAARIAGLLDPNRAVEMAETMPIGFLADVAVELDPRRISDVISRITPARIAAVTRELVRREEYVTMGRFVGQLGDDAVRAAFEVLDDRALLRVAFVLEATDRLDHLMGLLPPERLDRAGRCRGAGGHVDPGVPADRSPGSREPKESAVAALGSAGQRGLWPSRWPAEDSGSARTQAPQDGPGLRIGTGERLAVSAVRDAFGATMLVLRDAGELYALRHTLGRRPLRDPTSAWIERLDPRTLAPVARSPELAAGPFWPGGLAAHANGSLYVVYGRFCHRLSADLQRLASYELPQPRPYNSFVVLGDGTLAMKDLDRSLSRPARLTLLDPDTMTPRCPDTELPESAVARLSADADSLFVVGASSVYRYGWDGHRLERDLAVRYLERPGQSYGWDPVIAGGQLWFLDNGAHDYATTMLGAGVAPGPVHLIRISLSDPADREAVPISGLPRGAVTNPPVYDPDRRIALGYDSANGIVGAFRFGDRLTPLWHRRLAHAAHMIRYADTGEVVMQDWSGPSIARTRAARFVGRRAGWAAQSARVRRAAASRSGDDVVVIDLETGEERARARVPTMFQSVLFPAPGWERDLYWCTMSTIARLEVAAA